MWELDHEEGWAWKNWCFRSVVLEKTLESPLDCKEIQPVHPTYLNWQQIVILFPFILNNEHSHVSPDIHTERKKNYNNNPLLSSDKSLWLWGICQSQSVLRVPWTARRSSQSILKEINPEYSLEELLLKLKLQTLATWCKELTHWERP